MDTFTRQSRRECRQSRPINGRKLYRVQSSRSSRKETEPQGLTEQQTPATLRSIDTQKARHSTNPAQAAQDARESARHSEEPGEGREDASEKRQMPRKAARIQATKQQPSSKPHGLRLQRASRTYPHASKRAAAASTNPHRPQGTDCTDCTDCKCSEGRGRAQAETSRTAVPEVPRGKRAARRVGGCLA